MAESKAQLLEDRTGWMEPDVDDNVVPMHESEICSNVDL